MPKPIKTNAMRQLDAARIAYEPKTYEVDESDLSGVHIAEQIGLPFERTFKTLVATGDKTGPLVFCLPAHRDEEIAAEVMDSEYSIVFDEAENRLHVQKALMSLLLDK